MLSKCRSGISGLDSSFFAIMRGECCAKKVRVPLKFMRYLSGDLKENATLITNSTTCWRVAVSQTGDTIYFKGGWENFFRHHSLGNDELVSFTYKGNMHFHVQIFGVDLCRRTEHEYERTPPLDSNPRHRPLPASMKSFTSSFPYFKICLTKSAFHPYYMLPVPKKAQLILNLPSVSTQFIMRTRERVWDVRCLYVKEGHQRFSKGWRSFVDDNHLKVGDTCVFEIVDSFELHVTFFRS